MIYKDNCPICEKKMDKQSYFESSIELESYILCPNGCYGEEFIHGSYRYSIFNKEFTVSYNSIDSYWRKLKVDIDNEIKYWKENDRYLGEILSK